MSKTYNRGAWEEKECPECGEIVRGGLQAHLKNRCPEYVFRKGPNAGKKRSEVND